jgi:hypothetical protein
MYIFPGLPSAVSPICFAYRSPGLLFSIFLDHLYKASQFLQVFSSSFRTEEYRAKIRYLDTKELWRLLEVFKMLVRHSFNHFCAFFLYAEAGDEAAAISSPFIGWNAASFVAKDTSGPNPPCGFLNSPWQYQVKGTVRRELTGVESGTN